MSSIEKAIERLIAKNKQEKAEDNTSFGTVEDIAGANNETVTEIPATAASKVIDANPVVETSSSRIEKNIAPEVTPSEKKICHMDYARLDEAGFLTPNSKRNKLSEEYRIIKRPILKNAFNLGAAPVENGNLVVVTSATAGEGKTYTSLNLATSIAMELDTTILLVDLDIIKRSLTMQLGLENELGFMDILKDPSKDMSDVIMGTDLSRLKVLPAGQLPKNPTELLASGRMRSLIKEMAERYSDRIILFDAPPLLETTEASVIISLMGQVLVVVEAGGVPTDVLKTAVSQIGQDKVIGMILNKARYANSGYYGGYYGVEQNENMGNSESWDE